MSIFWNLSQSDNGKSLVIQLPDMTSLAVPESHVHFDDLVDYLMDLKASGDDDETATENIQKLFNIVEDVSTRLRRLSDRITTDYTTVYFDGDEVDSSIADFIIRALRKEDEDAGSEDDKDNEDDSSGTDETAFQALVNFMEKLYTNPSKESIENLYTFIRRYRLTILDNGDFIAYKGLDSNFRSIHSGPGIVDKVMHTNAHLDNSPGRIIEVARSYVSADRHQGCSTGLHAGTLEYARRFSIGKIVAVAINPRDVVSIPVDFNFQKIRTARYTVLTEIPFDYVRNEDQTVWNDDEFDDEDDDDFEDECNCEYCHNGDPHDANDCAFDCDCEDCNCADE